MEANNMKAMREALENSIGLLEELVLIGEWGESAKEQIVENRTALAAPLRNCDVGSAEEQSERFGRFCGHYRVRRCKDCPLLAKGPCEFEWAQMPYGVGL